MHPDDKYYKSIIKSFASNFKFKYGPEYIVLDITNKCNCRCLGCWIYSDNITPSKEDKILRSQFIPFKYLKRLVSDLVKLGTKEIRITGGGEPFVHPNLLDLIGFIKKKGLRCDLTTNFTLVNEEIIYKLINLKLNNLTLSLWAGDSDTYIKTHPTKSKDDFEKIKKLLTIFSISRDKNETKIVIANVISNLNYNNVNEMLLFAKKTFVDEVYFTLIDPIIGKTDQFLLSKKEQKKLSLTFKKIKETIENYPFHIDNIDNIIRRISSDSLIKGEYDKNILPQIHCYAGWNFARILANGDVVPCCKGVNIVIGNIIQNRFIKLWNSKKSLNFRKQSYNLDKELVTKVECFKTCDNLMQNIEADNKIKELNNDYR